jgi:hypothetical protein
VDPARVQVHGHRVGRRHVSASFPDEASLAQHSAIAWLSGVTTNRNVTGMDFRWEATDRADVLRSEPGLA